MTEPSLELGLRGPIPLSVVGVLEQRTQREIQNVPIYYLVKFRFAKKSTKNYEIFTVDLTFT